MNGAYSAFEQPESDYVERWAEETEAWNSQGLYAEVAERIIQVVDPLETHVDLCMGLGGLLYFLRQLSEAKNLIGVDSNIAMLMAAGNGFEASKILSATYLDFDERETESETIERIFVMSEESRTAYLEAIAPLDRPIQIIGDDIRNQRVIQAILRNRQIDSGSFMFRGGYLPLIVQDPYPPAEADPQRIIKKLSEVAEEVRQGAMRFMCQFLRTGGVLTIVDRYGIPRDANPDDYIETYLARTIAGFEEYWGEYEGSISAAGMEAQQGKGIDWIPSRGTNDKETESKRLIIAHVKRNNTPYPEAA